jgi:hypothetical protein
MMAVKPDELVGAARMQEAWKTLIKDVRRETQWQWDDIWDAWRDLHKTMGIQELHKKSRTLQKLVAGSMIPDPIAYDLLRVMFNLRLIDLGKEPMMPPFLAGEPLGNGGEVVPLRPKDEHGSFNISSLTRQITFGESRALAG